MTLADPANLFRLMHYFDVLAAVVFASWAGGDRSTPRSTLSLAAMVAVTVVPIAPGEEGPLANLLQLYQYDFSQIEPSDVASDGRFHQLDDVAFEYAYLVYASGQLAGFALVGRDASHAIEGDMIWSMEEFFIMRKYRRASIGTRAAQLVIERHPGTWEITQTPHNTGALAFWRQALAPYAFEEGSFDHPGGGRRSLQRFVR